MKKFFLLIIKISYILFIIYFGYLFYLANIIKVQDLGNVYIPSEEYEKNPKIYDDREKNFDPVGFYLKIPRIKLLKSIIKDADLTQLVSAKGIFHGRYSSYPNRIGNVYLFSPSVNEESEIEARNAWFTKLDELKIDDFVYIYYHGAEYKYQIVSRNEVFPDAKAVYTGFSVVAKITLQTNYPLGLNDKRLIYEGILVGVRTLEGVTRDEVYSFDGINAIVN